MRRALAYLLVWGLGTTATIGACWLGLSSVVDTAVPQRTAPFSAAELAQVAASPTPSVAPPRPDIAVASQAAPVTASPTPTASTPADPPASAVLAQLSQWQPVANGRGGTAYRRTFHLQGGDIQFYADSRDVHVVALDLRSGYVAVPSRYDSRSLLISLVSNDRASRVYVAWRGGPYAELTETIP